MPPPAALLIRRPTGKSWNITFDRQLNQAFADAFWKAGLRKRARALLECSRHLTVDSLELPDGRIIDHVVSRHACRERGCYLCDRVVAWRRRRQLLQVFDEYDFAKLGTKPVYMVLSRPAVPYQELADEFKAGHAALRKLFRSAKFSRAFGSFFRSGEFNYNPETRCCNFHFNIVAMAVPNYFRDRNLYLDQKKDLEPLWRRCCGAASKRICHIQAIPHDDGEALRNTCFEVAKYTTKSINFAIQKRPNAIVVDEHAYVTIVEAMRGVRFTAFGGLFKDLLTRIRKREEQEEKQSFADRLGARHVATRGWQWSTQYQRYIASN